MVNGNQYRLCPIRARLSNERKKKSVRVASSWAISESNHGGVEMPVSGQARLGIVIGLKLAPKENLGPAPFSPLQRKGLGMLAFPLLA